MTAHAFLFVSCSWSLHLVDFLFRPPYLNTESKFQLNCAKIGQSGGHDTVLARSIADACANGLSGSRGLSLLPSQSSFTSHRSKKGLIQSSSISQSVFHCFKSDRARRRLFEEFEPSRQQVLQLTKKTQGKLCNEEWSEDGRVGAPKCTINDAEGACACRLGGLKTRIEAIYYCPVPALSKIKHTLPKEPGVKPSRVPGVEHGQAAYNEVDIPFNVQLMLPCAAHYTPLLYAVQILKDTPLYMRFAETPPSKYALEDVVGCRESNPDVQPILDAHEVRNAAVHRALHLIYSSQTWVPIPRV
ncbi:hypothetical protein K438DRAFT_1758221 [Mycena galopus ATCC 62051]|nr:hypothetical protein K438DRAFT_1758221 [Mycena galopus ATCC 62051]